VNNLLSISDYKKKKIPSLLEAFKKACTDEILFRGKSEFNAVFITHDGFIRLDKVPNTVPVYIIPLIQKTDPFVGCEAMSGKVDRMMTMEFKISFAESSEKLVIYREVKND